MAGEKQKQLSLKNTKHEMLEAYNELLKKMEEKREAELKPEQKIIDQKAQKAVETANELSLDGVTQSVGLLKVEINKAFASLVEKLEAELAKYQEVKEAVGVKENELAEIYEIQKSASSLAALIEAQNQRRKDFEYEMEEKKQALLGEIDASKKAWELEKTEYETDFKERQEADEKARKREKEEYEYAFKREQQLAKDKFIDEKAKTEKELEEKKKQVEKELSEREHVLAEREQKMDTLSERISELEMHREEAIQIAVKENDAKWTADLKSREAFTKIEFEGERNVLTARIQSLEETVKRLNEQIDQLSEQLEKASGQVQDIAVRAIEGSSHSKLINQIQSMLEEKKHKEIESKVER